MGGSSPGHIVPGSALLILAVCVLFSQVRVHKGLWTPSGALFLTAFIQIILGAVGMVVEIGNGARVNRPFQAKEHITMYLLYVFAGMLILGESRGRLPEDTWRGALAVANLGVGLLFYVHSQMQMMDEHHPLESFVHWLLALACFGSSLGFAFSWAFQGIRLGALYIAETFLVLQSLWFYFLAYALYSGDYGFMGENLSMGDATSIFVWFALLAATVVGLVEFRYRLSAVASDSSSPIIASNGMMAMNGHGRRLADAKYTKVLEEDGDTQLA